MTTKAATPTHPDAAAIADLWCQHQGTGWSRTTELGVGGTAPVFEIRSPDGPRALKIYDREFSMGKLGDIEESRIDKQLSLKGHDCRSLVEIYDGGRFEDRLFLLMSRAPGSELEKRLQEVPRGKVRQILDDVARACVFLRERDICHRDVKSANVFVSDDFDHATLLDISVIRAIEDPIGVGTDHGGQLPMLATARYSPPEYLFRLLDAGPEMWDALTVYQLGALLHDLIVRRPLFQDEYAQSSMNRYRFAWVVATKYPLVQATDVDPDLVFLAQRALDKDWRRRSELRIEDFLIDDASRTKNALSMLGLYRPMETRRSRLEDRRRYLDCQSSAIEQHLVDYLLGAGVTATHEVRPGTESDSRRVQLGWSVHEDASGTASEVLLRYTLHAPVEANPGAVTVVVELLMTGAARRCVGLTLPRLETNEDTTEALTTQAEQAFCELARRMAERPAQEAGTQRPEGRVCHSGG
ncbi:MAG: protein kinase [Gammaproteobacteria bacterium]|nr:protein kinase [Gammaproteobacteria bacterium]